MNWYCQLHAFNRRSLVSATSGTAAVKSDSIGGTDGEGENNDKMQEGGWNCIEKQQWMFLTILAQELWIL